jgi:predicted PurR-regulated permease PerM
MNHLTIARWAGQGRMEKQTPITKLQSDRTAADPGAANRGADDQASPQTEIVPLEAAAEEIEFLHSSIQAGTIAQIVIAVAAAIGLLYLLKLVFVTVLSSVLLAFVLDPLVTIASRIHVPRWLGAILTVVLTLALTLGCIFFFYNRALDFGQQLPQFSSRIEGAIGKIIAEAEQLERSTRIVIPQPPDKRRPMPVEIQEAPGLSSMISTGSRFGDLILAVSFVPFLVYFMLTWKEHMHSATLRLFPKDRRLTAYRTIGRISQMIRSFIVGNMIVGVLNAIATTILFWAIGLPYFYFLGAICAFVGLIPYLGVFLALVAPLALGFGTLDKTGILILVIAVIGLHILTMNVLYPKIIGRRLRLNPLAVALALLFWAWIWGAVGLILALPVVGATKIVCDYVDSLQGFGAWLGDEAR